jgi:flagellar protein FlaG
MDASVGHVIQQLGPPLLSQPAPSRRQGVETHATPQEPPSSADKKESSNQKATPAMALQAVEMANRIADFLDKKISFTYDERIDQVIVKIVRKSTDEVIRQVPPEEMVELMAKLREDFRGLIFNHTG